MILIWCTVKNVLRMLSGPKPGTTCDGYLKDRQQSLGAILVFL